MSTQEKRTRRRSRLSAALVAFALPAAVFVLATQASSVWSMGTGSHVTAVTANVAPGAHLDTRASGHSSIGCWRPKYGCQQHVGPSRHVAGSCWRPKYGCDDDGTTGTSVLVGRWEQVHHCQDLVAALDNEGIGATAPAAVEDFFQNETAQELARKSDICSGAKPLGHSHYFNAAGQFGSLDQRLGQVDDGTYTVVDGNTVSINGSAFHYAINGNSLVLEPVITHALRAEALLDPLSFSSATWMEAVAYPGTTWHRVPCERWC